MKQVTVKIGDDDLKDLEEIFQNENSFKPMVRQDVLIIELMRQIKDNPKTEISESIDV
jgi:hypothetical protein